MNKVNQTEKLAEYVREGLSIKEAREKFENEFGYICQTVVGFIHWRVENATYFQQQELLTKRPSGLTESTMDSYLSAVEEFALELDEESRTPPAGKVLAVDSGRVSDRLRSAAREAYLLWTNEKPTHEDLARFGFLLWYIQERFLLLHEGAAKERKGLPSSAAKEKRDAIYKATSDHLNGRTRPITRNQLSQEVFEYLQGQGLEIKSANSLRNNPAFKEACDDQPEKIQARSPKK